MLRQVPTFALAVVLVASAGGAAQEGKATKKAAAGPDGVWVREAGGLDIKFDFTGGAGTFRMSAFKDANGVIVKCKYKVADGVVKAEVVSAEEKGSFPMIPPAGFVFGFKWAAKADTAELSDLTGDNVEGVRPVVEGEYRRAKAAKKD